MPLRTSLLAVCLATSSIAGLAGHHSLADSYDTTRTVALTGVIVKVEVLNPHAVVHLETQTPGGPSAIWTIELAPPGVLQRRGVDLPGLTTGRPVTVESWLKRNGTRQATGRTIVDAASQRVDVGDSMSWSSAAAR